MPYQHLASFKKYLCERILGKVKPAKVYFLKSDAVDIGFQMVCYGNLLKLRDIDLVCIGISKNGLIVFNNPAVADFNDPRHVKFVEQEELCRNYFFS